MQIIKYPNSLDEVSYSPDQLDLKAFYGLSQKVRFCKKCIYSNQKPNSASEFKHNKDSKKETVAFDEEGVCNACRVVERKLDIDWEQRAAELHELCDKYRKNDGSYDCLVPGSGGKDSIYAAHKLKHEFNMNPLTVTWAPHIYTDWGWENFRSWIHAGFDNYLFTPNGEVHRILTRLATEILFHPFQPFMMGQMCFPPKLAAKFNIPLVFYGEDPAEYGNATEQKDRATKDQKYFASDDLENVHIAGVSATDLMNDFGLSKLDLAPYLPADKNELINNDIEVHYLGYYLKWHPQDNYYYSVEHTDFKAAPERTAGTYSKYSSIDDKIDDFHYYTTFIKFGIGRATYDAAQEVRASDITREEAVALARRYDGEFPARFENDVYEYLSLPPEKFPAAAKMFEQPIMSRQYFLDLCNKFRSPHIWQFDGKEWKLRNTVWKEET
jgi:N-acetyl sugar amidotransferase